MFLPKHTWVQTRSLSLLLIIFLNNGVAQVAQASSGEAMPASPSLSPKDITYEGTNLYTQIMNFAYQTYDNGHYSALWQSSYFPKSVADQVSLQSNILFTGASHAQLHSNWLFTAEGYLALTTERNILRGMISNTRNTDQHLKFSDFKQLYALYRFGVYDFSLGKILVENSVARINSITDVFNEWNTIGYQDGVTVGTWHFRADYYNARQDRFSLMIFPFESWDNILSSRHRFYGSTLGYANLIGQNSDRLAHVTIQSTGYDDSNLRSWSWYARYAASHHQTEFFAGLYYGHSPYTVAKITGVTENETVSMIELRKPKAFNLMGGVSHTRNNITVYGETLLQWTLYQRDDHFAQFLEGIHLTDLHYATKIRLQELVYTLEISQDLRLKKQQDSSYYFSSNDTRRNIDALSLQIDLKKDEKKSGFFGLSLNYKDYGLHYFMGSVYQYNTQLFGQLSFNGYSGPSDSTFGRWKDNHTLSFSLNYDF